MAHPRWNACSTVSLPGSVSSAQFNAPVVWQADLHIEMIVPVTGKARSAICGQVLPDQELSLLNFFSFHLYIESIKDRYFSAMM